MLQELESFGHADADADDAVQASVRVRRESAVPASRHGRACAMHSWHGAGPASCGDACLPAARRLERFSNSARGTPY